MHYVTERPAPKPNVTYILGLDLAKMSDYSALVILERSTVGGEEATFAANYLHRWPTGTSYPHVVEGVGRALKTAPLLGSRSSLVIDATGVGMPVVDMFSKADIGPRFVPPVRQPGAVASCTGVQLVPVVITGGHKENCDNGVWHTPKRILVGAVQVGLQNRRLTIASQLPEAATLAKELQDFQLTISETAHDSYEGRKGAHDDLVLALALALWWGGRWLPQPARGMQSSSQSMFGEGAYDRWMRRGAR